jgi:hypothetical protein
VSRYTLANDARPPWLPAPGARVGYEMPYRIEPTASGSGIEWAKALIRDMGTSCAC